MRIPNLVLTKNWFDLILSGLKKEEYRGIKSYWISRLTQCKGINNHNKRGSYCKMQNCKSCLVEADGFHPMSYDTVRFTNGYGNCRPAMLVELKDIRTGFGLVEWGAPDDEKVFILYLRDVLETHNIKSP